MLLRRNFQGPCNSENYLFNNYLEAKNNLNDIIPPPGMLSFFYNSYCES